ncbi:flagellar motor protein MotB [Robbsia andropogonis]|uniref:flagellar motor protein MotB n=2 Tax=Robbsia andropogonis TaxID=28092 RepID=UPI000466FFC8|nr:flagellar motor protein MotB [Robbsia andropogonis]
MSDDKDRVSLTIIRRKSKGHHGGHHGGAWKIAYADFVTAMMAFFLLMWLLGSTTKGEKAGIADYFNTPLRVALTGGSYSGGATSILNGGGADMTKSNIGDVKHEDPVKSKAKPSSPLDEKKQQTKADDLRKLSALKQKIEQLIDQNIKLKPFKNQIRLDITSEGLRIQITDAQNRPMFASGSSVLAPYTKSILDEIGVALNDVENRVSVAGHTDSAPYSGGEKGYSNWELSSERANAARRELIAGGMNERKVIQVRGLADALPLDLKDPAAPMNRRISILVLNHESLAAFLRDGGRMDVGNGEEAADMIGASGTPSPNTKSAMTPGEEASVTPAQEMHAVTTMPPAGSAPAAPHAGSSVSH